MKALRLFGWVWLIAAMGLGGTACGDKSPSGPDDVCGDGIVTTGEACDDGNLVADDGCSPLCVVESGWTCDQTPSVCSPLCGDTLIVGGEDCDGSDLAGETCSTLGLDDGDLNCGPGCAYDVTGCTGTADCGNGTVEFPEVCDSTDLGGETCLSQGYGPGSLVCLADCTFDVSGCDPLPVCGNDTAESGEQCDGPDLGGQTCVTLGWDQGNLGCATNCTYDTSDCSGTGPICGNGQVEGLEACDDGNTDDCDGCRGDCSAAETGCGDGFVCGAETCDDANTDDCDGCRGNCSAVETGCGDGFLCGAEACDDGPANSDVTPDACRTNCELPGCGDGVTDTAEQCDNGPANSDVTPDACRTTCIQPNCGDTVVDTGELCDDGADGDPCDGCTDGCFFAPGCGDGVVQCSEECDDGVANSDVTPDACRTTCLNPRCGDAVTDTGEQCDDANASNSDACLNTCLIASCGDGFVHASVEQCDSADLDGETCVSQGHDGGPLDCTVNCNFDAGACVDCPPGLTYCPGPGVCVDVDSDDDHCGGCGGPCAAATVCIGGLCEAVAQPWTPVGTNPVWTQNTSVLAHDLATDGSQLTTALVVDVGGGDRQVHVLDFSGALAWNELAPSPSGPGFLDEAVAIEYAGATPYVAFGDGSGGFWGAIRVMFYQGGAWQEVGAPGFLSACGMHMFIDLALDGTTPHLTSMGAGGCGIGVDYGWYDGVAWQTRPSVTGFPGQLTMNGQGNPAIVYHNEALIGLADWDSFDATTNHTVQHWAGGVGAWADVDGELDMNLETGWEEHIALALDPAAELYTAWVEANGGAPSTNDIYVKGHDSTAGTWTLLGGGRINGAGSATLPSITVIGTTVWVAHVETANTGVDHVLVRRFDNTTSTWELIGPPLNVDVTENATAPVIVSMGGAPYVAFREETAGPGSPWQLYVKTFP